MEDPQINDPDAKTGTRRDDNRRIVTDGGAEAVLDHREFDPNELDGHRKNHEIYGEDPDIGGLVTDMEADGYDQGNPLTINPENTVIKGHRRWKAALETEIDTVPVIKREFESEEEEEAALLLDNILQRDQSFSQKMREAAELERINDKESDELGEQTGIVEEFLNNGEGRTRDKVASAVGLGSGETYRRAKRIWEAAEDGDAEADEQVDLIDTGEQSIHGAFTALQDDPDPEPEADTDVEDTADSEISEEGPGDNDDVADSGSTESSSPTDESSTDASTGTEEPVVSDENPPSPAELDDRDDPADEMMGRSEGGGVGEDAAKSPAEMAEDKEETSAPSPNESGTDADIPSPSESESDTTDDETESNTETSSGEDTQTVRVDDLVVDEEMANQLRERAEEHDQSPEEMLDTLITHGTINNDPELNEDAEEGTTEESDDESESKETDLMESLSLSEKEEEEVQARARELDLELPEVVRRLVGAWARGDESPFEMNN